LNNFFEREKESGHIERIMNLQHEITSRFAVQPQFIAKPVSPPQDRILDFKMSVRHLQELREAFKN